MDKKSLPGCELKYEAACINLLTALNLKKYFRKFKKY